MVGLAASVMVWRCGVRVRECVHGAALWWWWCGVMATPWRWLVVEVGLASGVMKAVAMWRWCGFRTVRACTWINEGVWDVFALGELGMQ